MEETISCRLVVMQVIINQRIDYLAEFIETIKLVQKLHKGTLNLTVSTGALTESTAADCIYFIHKYYAWLQEITNLVLDQATDIISSVLLGD